MYVKDITRVAIYELDNTRDRWVVGNLATYIVLSHLLVLSNILVTPLALYSVTRYRNPGPGGVSSLVFLWHCVVFCFPTARREAGHNPRNHLLTVYTGAHLLAASGTEPCSTDYSVTQAPGPLSSLWSVYSLEGQTPFLVFFATRCLSLRATERFRYRYLVSTILYYSGHTRIHGQDH